MRHAAVALLLAFLPVDQAAAWGADGHSIVAEIAERRLTAGVRAKVEELLGPGVSLASISSWADDVRETRLETSRWHFVSMALDETVYDPEKHCVLDAERGDCVVAEIARARRDLACDTIPTERAEALKFLVHFVGDLHQPLHTMKEKIGGNRIPVTVEFPGLIGFHFAEPTNLHVVWDSKIIERATWAWGSHVDRLEAGWLKENKDELGDDPIAWALAAHKDATPAVEEVGDVPVGQVPVLQQDYFEMMLPVVDRQLALAGLRLAHVLNQVLGDNPPPCT